MELEIHLEEGREIGRLAGRDEAELRWLAGMVWRELKGGAKEAVHECQVCGVEMSGGVVFCRICSTAHHEDCWTYLGKCSTYGCTEARFTTKC